MPYLTWQDKRIHYSEFRDDLRGRWPALVLVHGAGGNLYHWPPGLRRLPNHTVYAVDLPGHGRSEGSGCDQVEDYVEFLRDWADALNLSPFVLAGHSMGGAIAQTFALRYPKRLAGLALVATGARLRVHPRILEGIRADKTKVAELLAEWVHGRRATPAQRRQFVRYAMSVDTEVMYGDWTACNRFDIMGRLEDVHTPTLVIVGDQDRMTPVKYARYLADHIPDSDLVIIPDAGHMVMSEQPELTISAIAGFLERLS
ncbi:MAG: alpha/beta hydrolase [Chloroflexi bacterium]|nr:alpha/beta hydrolase [Chloroflexota bacterium]